MHHQRNRKYRCHDCKDRCNPRPYSSSREMWWFSAGSPFWLPDRNLWQCAFVYSWEVEAATAELVQHFSGVEDVQTRIRMWVCSKSACCWQSTNARPPADCLPSADKQDDITQGCQGHAPHLTLGVQWSGLANGHPSVFQDSIKTMAPCWRMKSPNGYCNFLATPIHPCAPLTIL